MKAVILAGGLGTRLREETEFKPKPMVDVGGRPILWHIMKTFDHHGLHDFVVCLGYRGDMIKDFFLNYEAMTNDFTITLGEKHKGAYHKAHSEQNFNVTLANTGADTMTGGRIKRIANYITDDLFMVTYGDGLIDVDIRKVIAFHKSHGALATVTAVKPLSRFGLLSFGEKDRVTKFAEKPQTDGWINAGYFVFNRRIFDYLDGDDCILEREPLEKLTAEKQLFAYRHDGFFFAMDTYREYQQLNAMWDANQAPWKVWK
jgi:glucose-1-phosphate cytidylyltransferase